MTEKNSRTLDVLIPVYRPDEKLGHLLDMLNRQKIKPEKIVLMVTEADSSAGDSRLERWISGSTIPVECHVLSPEEFDHGGTRNRGISYCDSEIVLCMTQDAVPENEELTEALIRPFYGEFCGAENGCISVSETDKGIRKTEILISYARQLPAPECKTVERYTRSFNYPEKSRLKTAEDIPELGIKAFFASNVCAAYRRELFWKQGGFPERTIFNEDMIFAGRAVKAGYGIAYAAEARVIHSHNLSGREQFHRNFDLAVSQTDHPEVFAGIRSEGEGLRLVKSTVKYLLKCGKFYLIPGMVWTTGCKYLGYLLGKRYKRLPKRFVRACSLNKRYWGDK